ncbi:hypothetical protein CRE_05316 [Caenorhabditis remanei]|uniref:F-box domain-containing protein n=1 Tax=Caenorhabditis remanei TaxID=31234 RepID=E3NQK4_CAERE|nr:hypothetical protein CRE_05316 [Caenorhabditis remanei]
MDPPRLFPILRLPFLAMEEVFKTMHPIEIINFSMISKRAKTITKKKTFYLEYAIHFCVQKPLEIKIHGTNNLVSSHYLMTSDKQKDGKTLEDECDGFITRMVFKYSKDPVDEWKQLCKYVLEIFNKQTIDVLTVCMDVFVDQNVSIIDFLKTNVKSVNECNLFQLGENNNVDEHAKYLLENIKITNKVISWLHIKNGDFAGKFPKNLKELYLLHSEWMGYEKLLEIDSVQVILGGNGISNMGWNSFIKKWIAMETHLNLELLDIDFKSLEQFRALVLYDIPHEVVDGSVKRVLKTTENETEEISGGVDIRRIDGKTATFVARDFEFLMSVH